MKKILLNQSKFTLVDDEDIKLLSQYKWWFDGKYAVTQNKQGHKIYLHRFIMRAVKGKSIDHINRDSLDNRKSNLRFATQTENMRNISLLSTNKSGYKGVHWDKDIEKWRVQISIENRTKHIGVFKNKIDAAKAYNKAVKDYSGEFAYLNQI